MYLYWNNWFMLRVRLYLICYQLQSMGTIFVSPSPWPYTTAVSLGILLLTFAVLFSSVFFSFSKLFFSLIFFSSSMTAWLMDFIDEGTFGSKFSVLIKTSLKAGMALFIMSEIFFFVSFFWSFFHFSISPSIWLLCLWPPIGIVKMNPMDLPLLNTTLLLFSGLTLTIAHRCISNYSMYSTSKKDYYFYSLKNQVTAFSTLSLTLFLGGLFTICQFMEYLGTGFNMNDSVFGSIFFMATGFHGLHVIVGSIFLATALFRLLNKHFIRAHVGFETGAWYWHFVDVVWLFLYFVVYWWGF